MYGIFGTGAVDWIREEELCQEFLVFDTPSIVVFKENANDDGEKYTGEFNWKKISTFASKKMQSFISIVHNDNYESFINRDPQSYKVLVFSDKKSPSALVKTLSKIYNGKLLFGYVRKDEPELLEKFQVTQFPTILVVTDPSTNAVEKFTGEIGLENLKSFFREYAYFKKNIPQKVSELGKMIFRIFSVSLT